MTPQEMQSLVMWLVVIFFGIGIHEYAHCKAADMAGDPTPRMYGRVTLNLFKHFDPVGSIMIIFTAISGFGIGWGKPAPMDPRKMKNPKWDFFVAVLAGPVSNLVQATIFAVILRLAFQFGGSGGPLPPEVLQFLLIGILANVGLFLFNLLPIGVLDGHWIVGTFLPERTALSWYRFNHQYGIFMLFGLVLVTQTMRSAGQDGPLDYILYTPTKLLTQTLTGIPLP